MPHSTDVQQALEQGARRSLEACTRAVAPREILTPEVLWRRYKWPIIGLGMFVLVELLSMGRLISVMGRHF